MAAERITHHALNDTLFSAPKVSGKVYDTQ